MAKAIFYTQKYTLVILLFIAALAFNPWLNTDIFEFPKLLGLIITTGFLSLINIFDILKTDPPNKIPTILKIFLVLLIAGNILAYIFSVNQKISLIGSSERFQGFLTQINYVLLGLNTFHFFIKYPSQKTEKIFTWLKPLLIITCSLAVLPYLFPLTFPFYIFTPAFFQDRIFGTFGNPNYLAAFLITLLPFFLLNYKAKTFIEKIIYVLFIELILIALFLTGSRSAWMASIIGFLFLGTIKFIKEKQSKIIITTIISITILALAIGLKTFYHPSTNTASIERLSLKEENITSLKTRLYLWKAGLKTYLQRPLTGYGPDALRGQMETHLPYYLQANEEFYIDRTHNEFLDILLQLGPLTLLAYLGFLAMAILKTSKNYLKSKIGELAAVSNTHEITALTALISLSIFHCFNFSIISTNILTYLLTAYLLAKNYARNHSPKIPKKIIDIKSNHS